MTTRTEALESLPDAFSFAQARDHGLSERGLYALRDSGHLEVLTRGVYRRTSGPDADPDLIAVAVRAPRATLCLTTALAFHQLTDEIPARIEVALPRGQRLPRMHTPVTWHAFNAGTFDVGRNEMTLVRSVTIGVYDPARCIIDLFRLRHRHGSDITYEALRRWVHRQDSQPSQLLSMARLFPTTLPAIRLALEVLL